EDLVGSALVVAELDKVLLGRLEIGAKGGVQVRVVDKVLNGIEAGEGRMAALMEAELDEVLFGGGKVVAEGRLQIGIFIEVGLRIEEEMAALGITGLDVLLLGRDDVGTVGLDEV